jgi:adapter protein MecA 1/2
MKIEPIGSSRLRVHVSHSDLAEHGLTTELIMHNPTGANNLIGAILDEAYDEFGMDLHGSFSVEMIVIPNEGLILVLNGDENRYPLTRPNFPAEPKAEKPQVVTDQIIYRFTDIELVISAAKILRRAPIRRGKLISYQNNYYLLFDRIRGREFDSDQISAILSEYGDRSNLTEYVLLDYGKVIIQKEAVRVLDSRFK